MDLSAARISCCLISNSCQLIRHDISQHHLKAQFKTLKSLTSVLKSWLLLLSFRYQIDLIDLAAKQQRPACFFFWCRKDTESRVEKQPPGVYNHQDWNLK